MPRPKKAPRVRLQITLSKPTAKRLRAVAKKLDRDISEVVDAALRLVLNSLRDDSMNMELKLNVPYPAPQDLADPLAHLTQPELIPRRMADE
jgi:hypothetical protein